MFTGLVAGTGSIANIISQQNESRFTIHPHCSLSNLELGESIAVNGVCLTVETFDAAGFTAYASAETLHVTTLGQLRQGSLVNLERALALGDRLGGHLVSGHVDGIATIADIQQRGSSKLYRLQYPVKFSPQIIRKGSIALDGISLTVNDCGSGFLEVNIIPETQKVTTIANWRIGQQVNFETDLIGKYVERMLGAYTSETPQAETLTMDFLRKHGF